jgi:hypothetical protein
MGVYPLTALTLLSEDEKKQLLANDIILCSELYKNDLFLNKIGVSKNRKNKIMEEIKELCYRNIK